MSWSPGIEGLDSIPQQVRDLAAASHLSAERLAVQLQARRRVGGSILHDVPAAGLQRLVRQHHRVVRITGLATEPESVIPSSFEKA